MCPIFSLKDALIISKDALIILKVALIISEDALIISKDALINFNLSVFFQLSATSSGFDTEKQVTKSTLKSGKINFRAGKGLKKLMSELGYKKA